MIHYPVMLPEVLAALSPKDGEHYLDGTFGNGGYSACFLEAAECRVTALDRDPNVASRAGALADRFAGRLTFIQTKFSEMAALELSDLDAIVLDIGVSSMQIDQPERGFSFMRDGPLDMRMGDEGPSASDAVMQLSHGELARLFKVYGEEKRAKRIADFIVRAREEGDIVTTQALAVLVEQAVGRSGKIHPATRIFQALRIFINDELGELYRGLCAAESLLKPGGRLIVVTFHSLEDRIVKNFLRRRSAAPSAGSRHLPSAPDVVFTPSFTLPKKSVTKPSQAEVLENPRSRSAKMRCAVRTDGPAFAPDDAVLPDMPSLNKLRPAA